MGKEMGRVRKGDRRSQGRNWAPGSSRIGRITADGAELAWGGGRRRGGKGGEKLPKGKRNRRKRRGKAGKPGRRTRHRPGWRKH